MSLEGNTARGVSSTGAAQVVKGVDVKETVCMHMGLISSCVA